MKGVITGDIVNSSRIEKKRRKELLSAIQKTAGDISRQVSKVTVDVYRGDSFQIVVPDIGQALKVAILMRAGLQYNTPWGSKTGLWDARIALGIGTIDLKMPKISVSDGEAFHNSGRGFDQLKRSERLAIFTPWDEFNDEFQVSSAFADQVISHWTSSQAKVIYPYLLEGTTQKELAAQLGKTPQSVNTLLLGGKISLIEMYIGRYKSLIKKYGE